MKGLLRYPDHVVEKIALCFEIVLTIKKLIGQSSNPNPEPPPGNKVAIDSVSASGNDGNGPENTFDGSLDTRWSAKGIGQWIEFDLGNEKELSHVMMAFFRGDQRVANFSIQSSINKISWTEVFQGRSSGNTVYQEKFDIPSGINARYVRIVGNGNSANEWNSITEVNIFSNSF